MENREYQNEMDANIDAAWDRHRNVLAVLPTGGGKTVIVSNKIRKNPVPTCVIAHRQELVSQMSLALATCEVPHRIIGPNKVIKWVARLHTEELGRPFYDPRSRIAVAGVDTLVRRKEELKQWCPTVERWVIDEGHHVLVGNKWGTAVNMFPNAHGLGVTATPSRADGRGLGSHADGVYDTMVEGPTMRALINAGYLCDYRIIAPPSDVDMTGVDVSDATGDYNPDQMRKRMRKSHIVGDVVAHYQKFAAGKQGVTFAPDVETAIKIAQQFKNAGINAEVIHGKTDDTIRVEIIRRFRRREIQQIVNVDILGEGFDVPGIEVVSFARPTMSFGLYCQQFGRALRILEGKLKAIIIDHVGNVALHQLPDRARVWTLDRRDKRAKNAHDPDAIPITTCLNPDCRADYESTLKVCPYCGTVPEVGDRSKPKFVDGDLTELDPEVLAAMRGEVAQMSAPASALRAKFQRAGLQGVALGGAMKQHELRREAHALLKDSIAWWAGYQRRLNRHDAESYRRFYYRFGIDVLSAQALPRPDAERLTQKINKDLVRLQNETHTY